MGFKSSGAESLGTRLQMREHLHPSGKGLSVMPGFFPGCVFACLGTTFPYPSLRVPAEKGSPIPFSLVERAGMQCIATIVVASAPILHFSLRRGNMKDAVQCCQLGVK